MADVQNGEIKVDTESDSKHGENKFYTSLRKTLYVGLSYALGGWSQWEGEFYKITGADPGEDPNKFPEGLKSLSMTEEFLEGGVSAAIGSVALLQVYKHFRAKEGKQMTHWDEICAITIGGAIGYGGMSILGGVLHGLIGRPDVPTLETINNLFGK